MAIYQTTTMKIKMQNGQRKLKFENYENVLEETQIENKINHSEK